MWRLFWQVITDDLILKQNTLWYHLKFALNTSHLFRSVCYDPHCKSCEQPLTDACVSSRKTTLIRYLSILRHQAEPIVMCKQVWLCFCNTCRARHLNTSDKLAHGSDKTTASQSISSTVALSNTSTVNPAQSITLLEHNQPVQTEQNIEMTPQS